MEPGRPRIVEWYRVDVTRHVAVVALQGSTLLVMGCFLVSHALAGVVPGEALSMAAAVLGAVCVVMGPLHTILGFQRILSRDTYLAMRTDGVLLHDGGQDVLVRWDDLVEARHVEDGEAVDLHRRDAAPVRITQDFCGQGGKELARRVNALRRKAQWNLLPKPG